MSTINTILAIVGMRLVIARITIIVCIFVDLVVVVKTRIHRRPVIWQPRIQRRNTVWEAKAEDKAKMQSDSNDKKAERKTKTSARIRKFMHLQIADQRGTA